jgi:hypothetical protein
LRLIGWLQREGDPQRLDEMGRHGFHRQAPLRHESPFMRHRLLDVAIDESA